LRETNHVKIAPDLSLKLREFISRVIIINNSGDKEYKIISQVKSQVEKLLKTQDWLPEWAFKLDSGVSERDCVLATGLENGPMVTLVTWNSGCVGKIHDHLTWGALGVVSGKERCLSYKCVGREGDKFKKCVLDKEDVLSPGDVFGMDSSIIHKMVNIADHNEVSVSIHVYGKDLRYVNRSVFDIKTKRCLPNPNLEFVDLTV
jgi:predicted metal-dependent enzyme (double-stranded beta helix superfamily)